MDTFGPGSIIGLPAALNGKYSATAQAVNDSVLGLIPANRVIEILERNPGHMRATVKLLALEVARMRDVISDRLDGDRLHMAEKTKD
jgi:CRP-like cAMP-binding protein